MHINDDKLGDEIYQQGLSINRDNNQDKKKGQLKVGGQKQIQVKKCDIDLTFRDLAKKITRNHGCINIMGQECKKNISENISPMYQHYGSQLQIY